MHERTAEKNWPTNYKLVLLRFTQGNDKLKFIGQKAPTFLQSPGIGSPGRHSFIEHP
ncbi:MAG TPA: hypothetical protein VGJ66_14550 [Pyrinomonadaceae bacterium]|jgi:hypothetical protein